MTERYATGVARALLVPDDRGLYCAAGGFHIDPWKPVERAVITHAHSDHARAGSGTYLTSASGAAVLRARIGDAAPIEGVGFGETHRIGDVTVSLHPAGHLLGSAQVRVEHAGEVWVASGDYKVERDRTCETFEPVRCDTFITESTFGLPIYRWRPQDEVFDEINRWWAGNAAEGITSVVFAYSLGKAQRVLAGVDASIGPILAHGAMTTLNEVYRAAGVVLPETRAGTAPEAKSAGGRALVIAPPSAAGTAWMRKFAPASTAFVSGWMTVRGTRRRRSVDRGFVLSDHADWDGLLSAIAATGASRIGVTHGSTQAMARYLRESGRDAFELETRYTGETDETEPAEANDAPAEGA